MILLMNFCQPSSLREKANNNSASRTCFDSSCARGREAIHRRPVVGVLVRERERYRERERMNQCVARSSAMRYDFTLLMIYSVYGRYYRWLMASFSRMDIYTYIFNLPAQVKSVAGKHCFDMSAAMSHLSTVKYPIVVSLIEISLQ